MYLEWDKMIAFIYGRKSRGDQDSLEGQINSCLEWCLSRGMKMDNIKIFKDEGNASSEDWNREQFQAMLTAVESEQPDIVVCVEQFRICRTSDFPKFTEVLLDAECLFAQTESGTIQNFNNENDVLVSDVLTGIGKFQLTQIKKKLKRGMIQSAKKRNWVGKKVPVGYKYDRKTKRLILSKDAPIIRNLFELYMQGLSTKDIAYKFTFEEVTTIETDQPLIWTPAGVSRILNNIVYAGHSLYGKTTQKKIKGTKKRKTIKTDESKQILELETHDYIVNKQEWELVQDIKQKRNSKPPSLKFAKHTFSGLIKCAECGAVHSFQKSKGGKKRLSSCQTRTYSEDLTTYTVCKNGSCNLEVFENVFYMWLGNKAIQLEEHIELIKAASISNEEQQKRKAAAIKNKEKQIQQLTKTYKNIQKSAEAGLYDDDELPEKGKEVKRLKTQVKQLEAEVIDLETQEADSETDFIERILEKMKLVLNGKANAAGLSEKEINEVLTDFIDSVFYKKNGNQVELEVKMKKEITEAFGDIELIKAG